MAHGRGFLKQQPRVSTACEAGVVDPQEAARVAYALYAERGRADGRDLDDWLEAEKIILRFLRAKS